jgi:hypothetical protein
MIVIEALTLAGIYREVSIADGQEQASVSVLVMVVNA